MITAIVAMGERGEIGRDGKLLWRIREDLRRFKRLTMGHPVVMGRKTWESLPKALPGRTNIVITRQPDYKAEGAVVTHSLREALETAWDSEGGRNNVFIIGGGEIYRQAMPYIDYAEVTHVHGSVEDADTFFPELSHKTCWVLDSEEESQVSTEGVKYHFARYSHGIPF